MDLFKVPAVPSPPINTSKNEQKSTKKKSPIVNAPRSAGLSLMLDPVGDPAVTALLAELDAELEQYAPVSCPFCFDPPWLRDRRYRLPAILDDHMRFWHADYRPWRCPHCPRTFTYQPMVDAHIVVEHGGVKRVKPTFTRDRYKEQLSRLMATAARLGTTKPLDDAMMKIDGDDADEEKEEEEEENGEVVPSSASTPAVEQEKERWATIAEMLDETIIFGDIPDDGNVEEGGDSAINMASDTTAADHHGDNIQRPSEGDDERTPLLLLAALDETAAIDASRAVIEAAEVDAVCVRCLEGGGDWRQCVEEAKEWRADERLQQLHADSHRGKGRPPKDGHFRRCFPMMMAASKGAAGNKKNATKKK